MKVSDFDFHLPEELIAQHPAIEREEARLLLHEMAGSSTSHRQVRDLPDLLAPGDLLVLNNTRVMPARLYARRQTGGAVELLLLTASDQGVWRAMVNPARKVKVGELLQIEGSDGEVRMIERREEDGQPGAEWMLAFDPECNVQALLEEAGRMPLPPYIRRQREDQLEPVDRVRYQTVFAEQLGAVAAPTAGLHFTSELLARLEAQGVQSTTVTLHVGIGTFAPVKVENTQDHRMHAESYVLGEEAISAIRACREAGGRVIAVGTTSVRVLEACSDERGLLQAGSGETRLFITPGYSYRVVDGLLTNFHLPQSTLLMLVSALCGRERLLELYREAIESRYRFYSYGDAMLLL